MQRYINILIICSGLIASCVAPATGQLMVKHGMNILPNGKFAPGEWNDAAIYEIADKLKLFMKQDSIYLYFGMQFADTMHTGIDLYIAHQTGIRKKLHVSSAIGEMDFTDGTWSDWKWGANHLWIANSIGQIIEDGKQKVVPLEGFEFQIKKSILPGNKWYALLHLKRPETKFPENALPDNPETWFTIEL